MTSLIKMMNKEDRFYEVYEMVEQVIEMDKPNALRFDGSQWMKLGGDVEIAHLVSSDYNKVANISFDEKTFEIKFVVLVREDRLSPADFITADFEDGYEYLEDIYNTFDLN